MNSELNQSSENSQRMKQALRSILPSAENPIFYLLKYHLITGCEVYSQELLVNAASFDILFKINLEAMRFNHQRKWLSCKLNGIGMNLYFLVGKIRLTSNIDPDSWVSLVYQVIAGLSSPESPGIFNDVYPSFHQ